MLSVFIVTGQEELTLCVVHSYEHCKGFGDTSELQCDGNLFYQ